MIATLHRESTVFLTSAEGKKGLTSEVFWGMVSTPEEFGAFLKSETTKWVQVANAAGIVPV